VRLSLIVSVAVALCISLGSWAGDRSPYPDLNEKSDSSSDLGLKKRGFQHRLGSLPPDLLGDGPNSDDDEERDRKKRRGRKGKRHGKRGGHDDERDDENDERPDMDEDPDVTPSGN